VPDAPPVIRAIRPVRVLVGMGVLGLARTTRVMGPSVVRPPVANLFSPCEESVKKSLLGTHRKGCPGS